MATTTAKAKLPPPGFEPASTLSEAKKSDAASIETKGPSGESKASSNPELSSQKDANLVFDNENTAHFDKVCAGFRKMHSHPVNIVGHFVTTPLCFFAVYHMIGAGASLPLTACYLVTLLGKVPTRIWLYTAGVMLACLGVSQLVTFSWLFTSLLFVVGYGGQDLLHIATGEPTFQSTYDKDPDKMKVMWLLAEHTYYLFPLVVDAGEHHGTMDQFLYWFIAKNEVMRTRLDAPEDRANIKIILDWIKEQKPCDDVTTHWWFDSLPDEIKATYREIANSPRMLDMFRNRPGNVFNESTWETQILTGMNEVYVASLSHKNNSDTVFYTDHIDGPFVIWPGARVYRCMVALNYNEQIQTCFSEVPSGITLTEGDAIGFDFNREIHYIRHNEGKRNKDFRIALKIHYVVYPKILRWYGRALGYLTTQYDILARKGFLATLKPKTEEEKFGAWGIIVTTKVFTYMNRYLGCNNMFYVYCLFFLSLGFGNWEILLLGTSFVHYMMYINTYYHRDNVAWGRFVRDVVFFKTIAVAQLVCRYLYVLDLGTVTTDGTQFVQFLASIALLVFGYGIAFLAAKALGLKRTYFGVELDLCKPKFITEFPYSHYAYFPHPMILGGILGLSGFHMLPAFRAAYPLLVPTHILFYMVHMIQEHFDIYKKVDRDLAEGCVHPEYVTVSRTKKDI